MSFGQASGPPASSQQLRLLGELLATAGHADFRDARKSFGLTQRQALGKFTRTEADELIERLQGDDSTDGADASDRPPVDVPAADPAPRRSARTSAVPAPLNPLRNVPSAHLAAELQRRGWAVVQP